MIFYVPILWTVEEALLFWIELSKTWYKALLLYINPVNSVSDKSWTCPCVLHFFFINICDILLTIIQVYWSGIGWPTRNVIQKALSFLLKRQLAIWLLVASWLAKSADLWCFPYCSGLNYYINSIYYFCYISKQLRWKLFKILKGIFPIFYSELCHRWALQSIVFSCVHAKWTEQIL